MSSILNYPHLGIFIIAWFTGNLLIPLLIKMSNKLGLLDRPGGHKGQKTPVPFLGGIGIFIAFTVSVCSTLRFESLENFVPFIGVLLGGAVVVTLGLLDDLRPIRATVKLSILFLITLVLAMFDIHLRIFPELFWNLPNILITLMWIVGVTSATNSLDNTDGVAGGVAAIAGVFTFFIAWGTSAESAQPWLSYLAVALIGSCFGFLRYNFSPARIYLGDNGAFFLGYILAVMLVFGHYTGDFFKAILVPPLILSVPIFDICLAIGLRIRDGDVRDWRSVVTFCGRDHLAHLLMARNFSKRETILSIYGMAIAGGTVALMVMLCQYRAIYLGVTGIYLAFLFSVGVILGRVRLRMLSSEVSPWKVIQLPKKIPGIRA